MIVLEVSDADAELFREFRRVQSVLAVMNDAGVFRMRNGKVVLNFNGDGVLENIEMRTRSYTRGRLSPGVDIALT